MFVLFSLQIFSLTLKSISCDLCFLLFRVVVSCSLEGCSEYLRSCSWCIRKAHELLIICRQRSRMDSRTNFWYGWGGLNQNWGIFATSNAKEARVSILGLFEVNCFCYLLLSLQFWPLNIAAIHIHPILYHFHFACIHQRELVPQRYHSSWPRLIQL